MFKRLLVWLLRKAFDPPRGEFDLQSLKDLSAAPPVSWLLTQERARLNFLWAEERFSSTGNSRAFTTMMMRMLQLQATNALVQSLLNEQTLDRILRTTGNTGATAADGKLVKRISPTAGSRDSMAEKLSGAPR